MRIDNTIRGQIQSTAESAASSSASAEEKTSAQSSSSSQDTDSIEKGDSNLSSALRTEIAGALGLPESSPKVDTYVELITDRQTFEKADAERVAGNEAIINDAITYGRREETKQALGFTDFKEFVPGASGELKDFAVRWGHDELKEGIFSDEITRFTKYSFQGNILGTVTSLIKDGMETITDVDPAFPGAIDLKPGDTRALPDPTNSLAGTKPSTWDPKPDGSYGKTGGSSSSSPSNDTQSSSGGPTAGGGVDHTPLNDGSNTTSGSSEPSGDGAVSDPSEWESYPGSSGSSGLYATAVDARDDGSVLITTSDGESHEFSNFDDAAAYTQQNLSPPPSTNSSGGTSGDEADTHTSVEGETTVEVEAPESEGTKISEGEEDKYYAWGEGGSLDFGSIPETTGGYIGKESTSSASGSSGYKAAESSGTFVGNPLNVVENIAYFDRAGKFDQAGGVTDGSRPDMEDSSAREAPYEGPGFGVIDTTPEVDDYATAVRDPNDNLNLAGSGGDPMNPDNPIEDARPDGGPPSTDPQSHDA